MDNKLEEDFLEETEEVKEDKKSKKEKRDKQKEQIEALELENKVLKDKLLRNVAELENFKKRMHQERIAERKYAAEGFIQSVLDPIEQFTKIVEFKTDWV